MTSAPLLAPNVSIAAPRRKDRAEFLTHVWESRRLHGEWVSPPDTPELYSLYLRRLGNPRYAAFLIRDISDGDLVGAVNVSEIVRGDFMSAYLGYFAFARKAGRGLMTAGLNAVVRHALSANGLGLHRVEANIQPDNLSSLALARRCGFRMEGMSRHYLRIAGVWRDHERWALTVEDLRKA
jgi:ribosomal-protein-alanine N-acetyltransferase